MMFRIVFFLSSACVWIGSHGLPTHSPSGNQTRIGRMGNSCETNDWDKQQWCLCGRGEKVSKIYSIHDNKKEDRQWTLTCSVIEPEFKVPESSDWYEVTEENEYDEPIAWNGKPDGYFLVGMTSVHDNKKEDRKYKFFIVRSDNWYFTDCKLHHYINDYDGKLEYTLFDDEVFTALYSWHRNDKEDRQWTIKTCKLKKKCTEISKIEYDILGSVTTADMVTAMSSSMRNKLSLDASFSATISNSVSNSLSESYSYSQTSGWTNEVSMSVTAGVEFGVPLVSKGSLEVSVGASHSWSFEETWTRSNSREYSEATGRQMTFTGYCRAGCNCTMNVLVQTVKAVIPYTMTSQSVDGKYQCEENGELKVDYAFDGDTDLNEVC